MTAQRPGFLDKTQPQDGAQPAKLNIPQVPGWVGPSIGGVSGPITQPRPEAATSKSQSDLGWSSVGIAAVGVAILLGTVLAFDLVNFVTAQFDRNLILGVATASAVVLGLSLIGWAAVGEWRSLSQLKNVDDVRRSFLVDDVIVAREAAASWLNSLPSLQFDTSGVSNAPDLQTLYGLLETGPLAKLDESTSSIGKETAGQIVVAIAMSPWAGLDGVIVVWRSMRMVRRIAELYGLRPGVLGTVQLLRRVAQDGGTVAVANVAVAAAVAQVSDRNPLLRALAGNAAGSAVAIQRVLRLARAVGDSCRPLKRQ
jgi:putative membrane protein